MNFLVLFFPDDPNPVLFDFLDWLGAAMSGKVPLFRMQTQSVMVCCLSGARRSVTHQTGLLLNPSPQSSSLLLRFRQFSSSLQPLFQSQSKSLLWMSVFILIESRIAIAKISRLDLFWKTREWTIQIACLIYDTANVFQVFKWFVLSGSSASHVHWILN